MRTLAGFVIFSGIFAGIAARAASNTPQSITLDGKLYSDTSSSTSLVDPSIQVVVQVLSDDKTCVLYEETQTISTALSDGSFNIQVGSVTGAAKRSTNDSNNAMSLVFQNMSSIPGKGGSCTNPYVPSTGKVRYMRVSIFPSTTGVAETLSPDILVDSVPQALVAETLQGIDAAGFLQLGAQSLTQANVANVFTTTNYATLVSLLAGSSSEYIQNTSTGASLPAFAANQPAQLQVKFGLILRQIS